MKMAAKCHYVIVDTCFKFKLELEFNYRIYQVTNLPVQSVIERPILLQVTGRLLQVLSYI